MFAMFKCVRIINCYQTLEVWGPADAWRDTPAPTNPGHSQVTVCDAKLDSSANLCLSHTCRTGGKSSFAFCPLVFIGWNVPAQAPGTVVKERSQAVLLITLSVCGQERLAFATRESPPQNAGG